MIATSEIITKIRGMINDNKKQGRNIFEYKTDTSFTLSEDYVSSVDMTVYKNGILLTETTDWTYNTITNRITIIASMVEDDNIIVNFNYFGNFSDLEITNHIRSNLAWFTVRRYKKTFYMNSNNEVVTLDGINPTEEESNIIAAITAIDISPNNFKVHVVGSFSIDAEENKSKSELRNDVFDQFLTSWGSIDFMEDEN